MSFEQLLKQALPDVDPEAIDTAVKEYEKRVKDSQDNVLTHIAADVAAQSLILAGMSSDLAVLRRRHDIFAALEALESSHDEEMAMLRGEIGRLNLIISRHTEGVEGATRAGLDTLGERARQRRMEGYDDAHDDKHDDFGLTSAAIAYLMDARLRGTTGHGFSDTPPPDWPWDANDWKTKDIRQELVVAAALIIAEVERMDRAAVSA